MVGRGLGSMETERETRGPDGADGGAAAAVPVAAAHDRPRTVEAEEELREEIDNPIEQLKLLSGNDEQIGRYLDALEVRSPREREMLREIARTQPLARPDRFAADHRNLVEALESLARHGYRGTRAGARLGPLRPAAKWGIELVARYLVVSHIRNLSTTLRNLYGLREIEATPFTQERHELRRARMDAERMVGALETRSLGLPTFLIGGALVPLLAAAGRATGVLTSTPVATIVGVIGMIVALVASWVILRGAAMASRRTRLAAGGPLRQLWSSIGWCGSPPKPQTRTFVILAVSLTLGAWIIVPILVGIGIAT
jgi:hypothetical protein